MTVATPTGPRQGRLASAWSPWRGGSRRPDGVLAGNSVGKGDVKAIRRHCSISLTYYRAANRAREDARFDLPDSPNPRLEPR